MTKSVVRPVDVDAKTVLRDLIDRVTRLERPSRSFVLASPNGTRWRITIDNAGTLVATPL